MVNIYTYVYSIFTNISLYYCIEMILCKIKTFVFDILSVNNALWIIFPKEHLYTAAVHCNIPSGRPTALCF